MATYHSINTSIKFKHICSFQKRHSSTVIQRLCSKKNMLCGMGPYPYAGVDYNSPYLIVNSIVIFRCPPPLQRERGRIRKISAFDWAQLYLSANFQNNKLEKGVWEGRGKGWELTLFLWIDILWGMDNPLPELTLPHAVAGFNSHEMIMNLWSVRHTVSVLLGK